MAKSPKRPSKAKPAASKKPSLRGKATTDRSTQLAKPFVIRGKVTGANQKPLANMTVRAFKRDLRTLQLLGTGETGANGEYSIGYHPVDSQRGVTTSHRAPWLIVEVSDPPNGQVMAKQEVQKAAPDQTISFVLPHVGAVPEWQRIRETVIPLLKGRGPSRLQAGSHAHTAMAQADLAPDELTAADVDFLAQAEELDRAAVDAWVTSNRMLEDALSRLTEEYAPQQATLREDGGPFFYAIARQGLAQDLNSVLRESAEKWRLAWHAMRAAHRVPAFNATQVNSVVEAMQLLQRLQQLDPMRSNNSDFARVLANSPRPLPKTVALDALTMYQEKGLSDVDALLTLTEKHPEAETSINTFVRGLRVHQLVAGHEGLARLLNARLEGTSDSIAPLATLSSEDWIRLAEEASVNQGRALELQAKLERQYPLAALQARVSAGHVPIPGLSSQELSPLSKKEAGTVESILRGSKPAKGATAKEESPAHQVLRDLGRFVRTGINMQTAGHLMSKGVATPAVAIRYGRETIREMLRDIHSEDAASTLVDNLFDTVEPLLAGANGFMIDVALHRRAPAFMQHNETQARSTAKIGTLAGENLPSLPGLFGDLDECICKPCESMLGQPAYLVDLLNLLHPIPRAYTKLISKRPDIPELKLNCEQAERTIQHIDIVLELLEKAATPGQPSEVAYERLAGAVFPWNLPFDRRYAELKACLAKLGVARSSVQVLRSETTPEQLAAETLGISFASEWRLFIEGRTGNELWAAYGFFPNSDGYVECVDPASHETLNLPVQDVLKRASVLMDQAGLALDELEQVLATEFVSGVEGGVKLYNREQCKTSQMRVEPTEGSMLETILDRLHRFVRLWRKLPDWSIAQVNVAIGACGGMESGEANPTGRGDVLADLATIKRLHEREGIPLDTLLERPISETSLRKALGLSAQEFALLNAMKRTDLTSYPFDWNSLEVMIQAAKRIRECGLTVAQVAEALLTRAHLIIVFGELPPSIKTDKQIEDLLVSVQMRLRAVVAIRSDVTLEAQATEGLAAIFDAAIANRLVKAIRDAGAKDASVGPPDNALVDILSPGTPHHLGEWFPLLSRAQADKILTVVATNNLDANARFTLLLEGIASRRRERELITALAAQCSLSEADIGSLLQSRLLLDVDGTKPTNADAEFLNVSFLGEKTLPPVTVGTMPRLHAWMDRLHRLAALSTALQLDSELLQIADRVVVGPRIGSSDAPRIGINWSEMLASTPPATSAWLNRDWLTLLDLLWLQKPEQLSRTVLSELMGRLAVIGTAAVSEDVVRPLATRVEVSEAKTLAIAGQAVSVSDARVLRDPTQLRRAFELLLLARHLGADGTQLAQLANGADNAQAAATAKQLLQAKVGQQAWPGVWKNIENQLRQRRRDALVAYVIHNNDKGIHTVNDLYEHYLIDPQIEPCFETTRILEAITAIQLFAQRILFGLEPEINSSAELKQRWTWMRNYRVWEANRKVFLFPENWMFPELRDDKSSSFKQLESALGQGELTQDLANQAFGEFLDDVAQMGQVQVLGMYEDIALLETGAIDVGRNGLPRFRRLYVIGRSTNPPYAYFWRHCVDFGSPYMEWMPWQRIELDIAGDHVLPFIIHRQLVVVWPVINRSEPGANGESTLEIKFHWSRHDGVRWQQPKTSRDEMVLTRAERFDDRQGVHLEGFASRHQQVDGEIGPEVAVLNIFTKSKYELESSIPDPRSSVESGSLTKFLGSGAYTQITVRSRGGDRYIEKRPIPSESSPEASAELKIKWSCWIKIKQSQSDPKLGYLQLAPKPGKRVIELSPAAYTTIPFASLMLGTVGKFLCVDFTYLEAVDLPEKHVPGSLPSSDWQVNSNFNGSKVGVALSSDIRPIGPIKPGEMATATLVFEIDASQYTIAELGLEDLVPSQFERRGSFELSADEVLRNSAYQIRLAPPASTEYWMNGSIEAPGAGSSSFAVTLPGGPSAEVLSASAPNLRYEVIPALYYRPSTVGIDTDLVPRVWHYREGQANTYVDVAHGVLGRTTKFCLYPAGFSETVEYGTTWRTSYAMAAAEAQGGLFDAHLLPLQIVGLDRATIRLAGDSHTIDKTEQRKLSFNTQFPYACYNWEVFFHAPLLIADQLSKQHKFEDAERWLRFVFDPTSGDSGTDAKRFLKFRVFKELDLSKQVIDDLTALAQVAGGYANASDVDAVEKLIDRWRDAPFRSFLIARRRHIAFLWQTLFAYLDNLIAWADSLYRRDSIESINEATMLYVLAERILGRRPQLHEGRSSREGWNYKDLAGRWDEFANFWIDVGTIDRDGPPPKPSAEGTAPSGTGILYFCMPFNDKILSYWNLVESRLSNVRNCRNIDGIERKLPLMDAPIDPELLVRATAAGLDLGEVISGLYAPPPHYRYSILSARAAELTNEAKALGAAMLSAIEKRDAEHVAQLRSSNEISLFRLVREVRTLQITEAERNIEALRASRRSVASRYSQYQRLLGRKDITIPGEQENAGEESMLGNSDSALASERSNLGLIKEENEQYIGFEEASGWSTAAGVIRVASGVSHALASALYPNPTTEPGGRALTSTAHGLSATADAFSTVSQAWRSHAEQQGMLAGHIRRRDDWAFQSNQTLKELQQIDKQILANQIRIDITKRELDNHIEQIEQAKAVDEVLRSKFSNEQLYQWMLSQLSGLYFNGYRMALEMARRAQRAAERELGSKPLNIIRNDYWDSLRSGLLAGERLHQDIKRLELAFLEQNRREYELTKHISLRRLDPAQLMTLKVTGACEFEIPEWVFDLETPGHFMRRIKIVSLSIPCVVGPYVNVNCKLTLLRSDVRHSREVQGTYDDDMRFTRRYSATESIVTSNGRDDSGLFETQMRDERFLPFESAGVISRWRLELPKAFAQFDFDTISDVIMHIRYTARDGGDSLRSAAESSVAHKLNPGTGSSPTPLLVPVLVSCKTDFPAEWARAKSTSTLEVQVNRSLLPYWVSRFNFAKIERADVVVSQSDAPVFTEITGLALSGDTIPLNLGATGQNVLDRLLLVWCRG